MWKGLFRFASLMMPKSWSDFWIPNRITDFNRQFILSRRDLAIIAEKEEQKAGIEEVSETEEEIQQKKLNAKRRIKQVIEAMKIKRELKPWREDKQEWEYFYLKDIKHWRLRGTLEDRDSKISQYWDEIMYFPRWKKLKLRYKRFKKFIEQQRQRISDKINEKMAARNVFQCPPITQAQAYMILNLQPPAQGYPELEVIWERYDTLNIKNATTTDFAGSIYLGSKIDSAKDYFFQRIPGGKQFDRQKIQESGVEEEMKRIQKQEEQDQAPEWLMQEELVQQYGQKQAQHFLKQIEEGKYVMPRWLLYRYMKVKQINILYYLEQKQIAQQQKKALIQRKRLQKQIRLQIQDLQDKVDKIVAQGGDASDIVFPTIPDPPPSKVQMVVSESQQVLNTQLQQIRKKLSQTFQPYQLQYYKKKIDPLIESDDFEVKLQFDFNEQLQKMEILAKIL